MSTAFNWTPVPTESWDQWRDTFNAANEALDIPHPCPICGHSALHVWLSIEGHAESVVCDGVRYAGHGRLWEWCSNCFNYAYLPDGLVPESWQPPFDISDAEIGPTPDIIEERRRELRVD